MAIPSTGDFPGFWIKLCKIVFILGRHVLKVIEMYTWGVSSISETLFWLSINGCHNIETWGFTYWHGFNTNPFRNSVLTVRWNPKVKSVYMHQAYFGFHIVFKGEVPILFFLLPRPHILLQEVGQRLLPPSLWIHRLIFSHIPLLICSFLVSPLDIEPKTSKCRRIPFCDQLIMWLHISKL